MYKLIYTPNIGFNLTDWEQMQIREVVAGTNCIMAITDTGEVLQKTLNLSVAARTRYWTRIQAIALSKCISGMAIGVVADGTCMISKRALRAQDNEGRFEQINNEVKSWTNIVQVAASDSYFGLDVTGNVHYAPLSQFGQNDYRGVLNWKNVRKIVTGTQNAIFGITTEGKVLAEGANCHRGPHGDISRYFASVKGVVDIFPTGSECENVFMLLDDGKFVDLNGNTVNTLKTPLRASNKVLDGTFFHFVLANDNGKRLVNLCNDSHDVLNADDGRIVSFAAGDINYRPPFAIAVVEL